MTSKASKSGLSMITEEVSLTNPEKRQLEKCEEAIRLGATEALDGFRKMAKAFHEIRSNRPYREHGTFAEYFNTVFGYSRSHSNRIADASQILDMSPSGDIVKALVTESHFRPLAVLKDKPLELQEVLDVLEQWSKWKVSPTSSGVSIPIKAGNSTMRVNHLFQLLSLICF